MTLMIAVLLAGAEAPPQAPPLEERVKILEEKMARIEARLLGVAAPAVAPVAAPGFGTTCYVDPVTGAAVCGPQALTSPSGGFMTIYSGDGPQGTYRRGFFGRRESRQSRRASRRGGFSASGACSTCG